MDILGSIDLGVEIIILGCSRDNLRVIEASIVVVIVVEFITSLTLLEVSIETCASR